ncbi:MAG: transglutaminase domain-containing protein [Candidatus Brennerbacteria bacterium]
MKGLPRTFYLKCLSKKSDSNLLDFLRRIRKFYYQKATRHARSFKESRFLTAQEILKRKIQSCGSICTIAGAVLRGNNIPIKLVHAKIRGKDDDNHRHSWLKIYNPLNKKWLDVDLTNSYLTTYAEVSHAYPFKTYRDWSELKSDYKKGKW